MYDDPDVIACFGDNTDLIADVDRRVELRFGASALAWEGDPKTFQFTYVSSSSERLLGYAARRWIDEPTFWPDVIIAPEDRNDAVAYCALATTRRADHVFEYRARAADGATVWLRDYVRVLVGPRGIATTLRGIMLDVTSEKRSSRTFDAPPSLRRPTFEQLSAMTSR